MLEDQTYQYNTAQIQKLWMEFQLSKQSLKHINVHNLRKHFEDHWNRLGFRLEACFLKLDKTVAEDRSEHNGVIWIPTSWFQHFKFQYQGKRWLRWYVRRWPVKYDKKAVTTIINRTVTSHLCPHIQVNPLRSHLDFLSGIDTHANLP